MALGHSTQHDGLSAVMQELTELWRTVSLGSVNDQPVKVPNAVEKERLKELLAQAAEHL